MPANDGLMEDRRQADRLACSVFDQIALKPLGRHKKYGVPSLHANRPVSQLIGRVTSRPVLVANLLTNWHCNRLFAVKRLSERSR